MREFERKIFEEFRAHGTSRGLSPKAQWIQQHLLEVKTDFPYSMWRRFRRFSAECCKMGVNLRVGNYASLRNYLRFLRRLDLIQDAKQWKSHSFEKHWVCLNKANLSNKGWRNPLGALYSSTSWRSKSKKEKSETLRKMRAKKNRKRGRPQKKILDTLP